MIWSEASVELLRNIEYYFILAELLLAIIVL